MIWQDILTEDALSDQTIVEGLVAGFSFSAEMILVSRNAEDFPDPGNAKLVCMVFAKSRGFRTLLSIYTYFDPLPDPIEVMTRFARETKTDCLLSDDSPNPYTMIRVLPSGTIQPVSIEIDEFDNITCSQK